MNTLKMIKAEFGTVVKLWLDHFAMMFFGTLILLPTANMKILLSETHRDAQGNPNSWMMPLGSAFAVLFLFVLLFITMCDAGLKDNVRIESGRIRKQWSKPVVLSLVANSVSLVLSAISCISKALIPDLYYFASVDGATGGAASVYGVSSVANEILHIMYKGLFVFFDLNRIPFIFLFPVILSTVVCAVAYHLGTKGRFASLFARNEKRGR